MNKSELLNRTKSFAVDVFKLVDRFPKSKASDVVSYQLLKAASSVAANYRATNRAKSKADFIHKLTVVVEEADECHFWLSFSLEVGIVKANPVTDKLIDEANQLVAIFTSSVKTSRAKP